MQGYVFIIERNHELLTFTLFLVKVNRESLILNRLSCGSHLARGNYHMSLEIVLQNEVSEGDWKFFWKLFVPVSYRNHHFDG